MRLMTKQVGRGNVSPNRALAAHILMMLSNATAHGEQQHTDECKYHLLPAVAARLTGGAVERNENANKMWGSRWPEAGLLKHDSYLHEGQIEEEGRETTKCIKYLEPSLSQVMTEQNFKMSRCGETCGKTSELTRERGGWENSQAALNCFSDYFFFISRGSSPFK